MTTLRQHTHQLMYTWYPEQPIILRSKTIFGVCREITHFRQFLENHKSTIREVHLKSAGLNKRIRKVIEFIENPLNFREGDIDHFTKPSVCVLKIFLNHFRIYMRYLNYDLETKHRFFDDAFPDDL